MSQSVVIAVETENAVGRFRVSKRDLEEGERFDGYRLNERVVAAMINLWRLPVCDWRRSIKRAARGHVKI